MVGILGVPSPKRAPDPTYLTHYTLYWNILALTEAVNSLIADKCHCIWILIRLYILIDPDLKIQTSKN